MAQNDLQTCLTQAHYVNGNSPYSLSESDKDANLLLRNTDALKACAPPEALKKAQACLDPLYQSYEEDKGFHFAKILAGNLAAIRKCYQESPELLQWRLDLEKGYTLSELGLLFFTRNDLNLEEWRTSFNAPAPYSIQPWQPTLGETEVTYRDSGPSGVDAFMEGFAGALSSAVTLGHVNMQADRDRFIRHLATTRDLIHFYSEGILIDDNFNFNIPKKNRLEGPKPTSDQIQQWLETSSLPVNTTVILLSFEQNGKNVHYLAAWETFPEPNPKDFETCSWKLQDSTPICTGVMVHPHFEMLLDRHLYPLRTMGLLKTLVGNSEFTATINEEPARLVQVQQIR